MKRTSIRRFVLGEIFRICDRNGTHRFRRDQLLQTSVIDSVVAASGSKEKHPRVTVAYELSSLDRNVGLVRNIGHGRYELTQEAIRVYAEWQKQKRSQKGQES